MHDHFLTIPGEFGADSDRIIGGISIGILFSLRSSDIPPRVNHYVKSSLQDPKIFARLRRATKGGPHDKKIRIPPLIVDRYIIRGDILIRGGILNWI